MPDRASRRYGVVLAFRSATPLPRVGDAAYDDLEDGSVSYSMETNDSQGMGEDNELAVQRLLWDLFDGNSDSRDAISRSDQTIWTAINAADPEILSSGWAALRAGPALCLVRFP